MMCLLILLKMRWVIFFYFIIFIMHRIFFNGRGFDGHVINKIIILLNNNLFFWSHPSDGQNKGGCFRHLRWTRKRNTICPFLPPYKLVVGLQREAKGSLSLQPPPLLASPFRLLLRFKHGRAGQIWSLRSNLFYLPPFATFSSLFPLIFPGFSFRTLRLLLFSFDFGLYQSDCRRLS